MKNKGFTLIETLVTVGVIGVLSAIATYGYHLRIAKTQTSEAILAMNGGGWGESSWTGYYWTSKYDLVD